MAALVRGDDQLRLSTEFTGNHQLLLIATGELTGGDVQAPRPDIVFFQGLVGGDFQRFGAHKSDAVEATGPLLA